MWDEYPEDSTGCPYCGEHKECPHLLAVLDRSFGECTGGYAFERFDELTDQVEAAFAQALTSEDVEDVDWDTDDLRELWTSAQESHDEQSGYVVIESTLLVNVVSAVLCEAGGEEFLDPATEGDAPAMSSSLIVIHAENPKDVFEQASGALAVLLRQA